MTDSTNRPPRAPRKTTRGSRKEPGIPPYDPTEPLIILECDLPPPRVAGTETGPLGSFERYQARITMKGNLQEMATAGRKQGRAGTSPSSEPPLEVMRRCVIGFEGESPGRWWEFVFPRSGETTGEVRLAARKAYKWIIITAAHFPIWLKSRYPKITRKEINHKLKFALSSVPRVTRAPVAVRRLKGRKPQPGEPVGEPIEATEPSRPSGEWKAWELARNLKVPQEEALEAMTDFTAFVDQKYHLFEMPLYEILELKKNPLPPPGPDLKREENTEMEALKTRLFQEELDPAGKDRMLELLDRSLGAIHRRLNETLSG